MSEGLVYYIPKSSIVNNKPDTSLAKPLLRQHKGSSIIALRQHNGRLFYGIVTNNPEEDKFFYTISWKTKTKSIERKYLPKLTTKM